AYAPAGLPAPTAAAPGPQGQAQQFLPGESVPQRWWTAFGDTTLDAAVERALQANPGLAASLATLRAAQESVAAQRAAAWPSVQLGLQTARAKAGGTGAGANVVPGTPPAGSDPGGAYSFHTAQLSVGFTPDVFGGNHRLVEGLQAQAQVQRFQLEAARTALAANVVGAAVQDALLRRQRALLEASLQDGARALDVARRQWQAGAISHLDLSLQENALAQLRQQLPPLQRQFEQNRDLLQALLGDGPDAQAPAFDLDRLALPTRLPLVLPGALVERRPDVRAAQAQLQAASAQVGVAVAARLPQFSISGELGGGAATVAQMFSPGGRFFALMAGVLQPVFDAGALQHRESAARANLDAAAAQYRSVVIAALQNVADALHALQADAQALQAAGEAAESAVRARDLTRRQFGHGYLDRVALISAEQAARQAQAALAQAQAARLADTAALFQALGGSEPPAR
ncbi:efflux transporter outer membrane subunit, partial [Ramlibacter sp.]